MNEKNQQRTLIDKLLNAFEIIGNKLPDPTTIFLVLCFIILGLSFILNSMGISAQHPTTKEMIYIENLISSQNLKQLLIDMVKVFQTYPPLGVVLVAMIGIGLAEKTGFLETLLILMIRKVPKKFIYFTVIMSGMIFTGIGDAGFVILPPLAAIIFLNIGKNPIIGVLLAYASAAIGFCSGLFVSLNDILLTSFTIPAAQLLVPNFEKSPAMTIYFNTANFLLQVVIITWVTIKFIEPRFSSYEGEKEERGEITIEEKNGFKYGIIGFLIYIGIIILLCCGKNAFFRDLSGSLVSLKSPFMGGLIPIMSLSFFIPGYIYGKVTKKIKSDKDVARYIGQSLGEMGGYIFIVFVSAQFLALFSKSNLGIILAIKGAAFIQEMGLNGIGLIIMYILLVAFINLFIGSASAKWAILSPVFVPMFMLLDYDPALTQMAYRIGDSSTNMISPLFPYMTLILAVAQRYDKKFGIGTLMANMIPYSLVTMIGSIILLSIFLIFRITFGV